LSARDTVAIETFAMRARSSSLVRRADTLPPKAPRLPRGGF
jgi:hypothetical protein